tara:strand:+ start:6916 stop:7641 length:726 start_codon:yes stop_codon:yes gene_type:complete
MIKKILVILVIILVIYFNRSQVYHLGFKVLGYDIAYFEKPSDNWSNNKLYKLDSLMFSNDNLNSIIYIPGRDINLSIELNQSGYTRNLLSFLIDFSKENNYNLFYYHSSHKKLFFKDTNSDLIDKESLSKYINNINPEILIGMSYGASLVEYFSCLKKIKSISIGGSIRHLDLNKNYVFDRSINVFNCINSKYVFNVIGSRDGDFENNYYHINNLKIYKGHHYITNEAINNIKTILYEEID